MKLTRKEIEMIKSAINFKLIHLIGEMEDYEPGSILREVAEENADEYVELYEKLEKEGRWIERYYYLYGKLDEALL